MVFLEILKDDILQLNFHTFSGSWAQFEELHGPFVNLGVHLPPKHNSPLKKIVSHCYIYCRRLIFFSNLDFQIHTSHFDHKHERSPL